MARAARYAGWAVVAILALIVIGYLSLLRGEIPYATLESRYAAPSSHYLDLPNRLHVHYRDEGRRDGPVLVLIHGFSASSADWDDWAERLGDTYRVIAPDLPGHGLTRAPKGFQSGPDVQVATVDAVTERLGLKRFVIAGNSMGGGVAWRYTLSHPEKVAGLVLVDAGGWPPVKRPGAGGAAIFALLNNPMARGLIKNLDVSGLAKQGLQAAFVEKARVTPALVHRYVDFSRAPGHRDILLQRVGLTDYATPQRLSVIAAPTLIMVGREDRLIPWTDGQRFAAAIAGSTLIVYPGVGHVPMQQVPDRSAADLRAWLEKSVPAAPVAVASGRTPITVRELPPARPAR